MFCGNEIFFEEKVLDPKNIRIRNYTYQKMFRIHRFMRKTTYTEHFFICVTVFEVFQRGLLFNIQMSKLV